MKSAPDLDHDLPAICPEVIVATVTQDKTVQDRLCSRARRHWKTNARYVVGASMKSGIEVVESYWENVKDQPREE